MKVAKTSENAARLTLVKATNTCASLLKDFDLSKEFFAQLKQLLGPSVRTVGALT